mmetsp:Transcript_53885/g.79009  ORF Transcript_53885/g.79009 Transcript_53885/m.79009 type:complete len:254 (-) Transcript_53885:1186-1947(-)
MSPHACVVIVIAINCDQNTRATSAPRTATMRDGATSELKPISMSAPMTEVPSSISSSISTDIVAVGSTLASAGSNSRDSNESATPARRFLAMALKAARTFVASSAVWNSMLIETLVPPLDIFSPFVVTREAGSPKADDTSPPTRSLTIFLLVAEVSNHVFARLETLMPNLAGLPPEHFVATLASHDPACFSRYVRNSVDSAAAIIARQQPHSFVIVLKVSLQASEHVSPAGRGLTPGSSGAPQSVMAFSQFPS